MTTSSVQFPSNFDPVYILRVRIAKKACWLAYSIVPVFPGIVLNMDIESTVGSTAVNADRTDVGTLWHFIRGSIGHQKDSPDLNGQRILEIKCTCWEVTFRGHWHCTKREQIKSREKRVGVWRVYWLVVSFNRGFYCFLYMGVNTNPWILL